MRKEHRRPQMHCLGDKNETLTTGVTGYLELGKLAFSESTLLLALPLPNDEKSYFDKILE